MGGCAGAAPGCAGPVDVGRTAQDGNSASGTGPSVWGPIRRRGTRAAGCRARAATHQGRSPTSSRARRETSASSSGRRSGAGSSTSSTSRSRRAASSRWLDAWPSGRQLRLVEQAAPAQLVGDLGDPLGRRALLLGDAQGLREVVLLDAHERPGRAGGELDPGPLGHARAEALALLAIGAADDQPLGFGQRVGRPRRRERLVHARAWARRCATGARAGTRTRGSRSRRRRPPRRTRASAR